MYLDHFKFSELPFSLTPNTKFYCDLPTYQDALNVLLLGLAQGEGFIKIIGEVGTGKTMLCRLLLNSLEDNFITAYIPNPDQTSDELHLSLAHELGLTIDKDLSQHYVLSQITKRLLELHQSGKQIVLIVDESQALSDDCLEAIRLLTNLETEEKKLLQVVLFGQPELNIRLNQYHLRQLKQRITFSYYLKSLSKQELDLYVHHRLARAGYTYGMIFSKGARKYLFHASNGLPRLLNILCHKALLVSYGRGLDYVDTKSMKRAIKDTESISSTHQTTRNYFLITLFIVTASIIGYLVSLNAVFLSEVFK